MVLRKLLHWLICAKEVTCMLTNFASINMRSNVIQPFRSCNCMIQAQEIEICNPIFGMQCLDVVIWCIEAMWSQWCYMNLEVLMHASFFTNSYVPKKWHGWSSLFPWTWMQFIIQLFRSCTCEIHSQEMTFATGLCSEHINSMLSYEVIFGSMWNQC